MNLSNYLNTELHKSNFNKVEIITYLTCSAFIIFLLANLILEYNKIPAFRHDEIKYYTSYYGKLVSEGRWLNYLFFNVIKTLDIHLIGILNIVYFVFI